MTDSRWVLENKKGDFFGIGAKLGVDPLIVRLMINRGITSEEEMRRYLFASFADMFDPELLKDIDRGAEIIESTIASGGSIVIASDYDADGIFSGELLQEMITLLGGRSEIMTPNRVTDGYGLNERMVREAAQQGARLILTCDNGIAAFDAIALAGQLGLRVVVTDHHEIPYDDTRDGRVYKLPDADAIINPKQADCAYPNKCLCGCGVALKLAIYLLRRAHIAIPAAFYEYAAIATVSDVMDLTGENRILVREGLKLLEHTDSVGLAAIIRAVGLSDKKLTAYHIGFVIGPCFNATGRLEDTRKAHQLLGERDPEEAFKLAISLTELNALRKQLTEDGVNEAIAIIEGSGIRKDKVLLAVLSGCHESLVGIIAGRIRERFNHPAIVFSVTEDGLKGSGRSIEGYHMYEALSSCKDLLTRFGGHAMAAGLSLPAENLPELNRRLNENCTLTEDDFVPVVRIDAAMPIGYITERLVEEISMLEPFGKANPKPLFAEKNYLLRGAKLLGKQSNILKLVVENTAGTVMDTMLFLEADEFIRQVRAHYGEGEWEKVLRHEANDIRVSLAYYPAINEFMGMKSPQITIQNYRFE